MSSNEPLQRKIKESMDYSKQLVNETITSGVEALTRLRNQGSVLRHANDNLSPLSSMTDDSYGVINSTMKELASGRGLFFVGAIITIIIIFLMLRWKHSGWKILLLFYCRNWLVLYRLNKHNIFLLIWITFMNSLNVQIIFLETLQC